MNPFTNILQTLKNGVFDFAGQAGMAIANFFADWVSGQEGAGKKLLAAFLGMIGQMLVKTGVMMIQMGIAEMALASTMIGKMMGFSHAAGARHGAANPRPRRARVVGTVKAGFVDDGSWRV
jgi:hypothetical protein